MMMEAEMITFAAITGVCREPRWILKVEKSGNKVHLVTTWPRRSWATGLVSVMLEAVGQMCCGQRQLCGRLDIHAKDVSL